MANKNKEAINILFWNVQNKKHREFPVCQDILPLKIERILQIVWS